MAPRASQASGGGGEQVDEPVATVGSMAPLLLYDVFMLNEKEGPSPADLAASSQALLLMTPCPAFPTSRPARALKARQRQSALTSRI